MTAPGMYGAAVKWFTLAVALCGIISAPPALSAELPGYVGCFPEVELYLDKSSGEEYALELVRPPREQRHSWHAAFVIDSEEPFVKGQAYRVSFDVRSPQGAKLSFSIKQKQEPWNFVQDPEHQTVSLDAGAEWKTFSFSFTAVGTYPAGATSQSFFVGANPAGTQIFIRNFRVSSLSAYDTLDISAQANFGFADEIAGDGKGGWSDQGPNNDFRSFPTGLRRFCDIPFNVISPEANGGRAIISFNSADVRTGLKETVLNVTTPRKYLYLLNAETYAPPSRKAIAQLVFELHDGSQETVILHHGVDSGNWWSPREGANAAVALEQKNDLLRVGAYVSQFSVPAGTRAIRLRTLEVSNWIVIAATLADFELTREPLVLCQYNASREWRPIPMPPYPLSGSALDLSGFGFPKGNPQRIVSHNGHLAFANAPDRPLRLRGSLYLPLRLFDWPGKMAVNSRDFKPDVEEFTDALVRSGFNMIRLHLMDLNLMKWEKITAFDNMPSSPAEIPFDPVKVDFYQYLVKCCRDRGIYITLDICGAESMFTDTRPDWMGNTMPKDFKSRLYYDEKYRKNWAAGATWLIRLKNPHTGNTLADENTIFLIEFCNEQLFDWSKTSVDALDAEWQKFQSARTGRQGPFPKLNAFTASEKSELGTAMNLFIMQKELELLAFYKSTVRAAGYRGLCFNFDNGHQISRIPPLAQLEVNSLHPYFAHVEWVDGKQLVSQDSQANAGSGFMAAWRLIDRPFVTTEYNYAFWNQFRHESGLIQPVVASLNAWDGITTHCEAVFPVQHPLDIFFNGPDPVNRAYEVVSEYIYKRGYVKPNPGTSAFIVTDEDVAAGGKSIINITCGSILSWLTRTGILYTGAQEGGIPSAQADIYLAPQKNEMRDSSGHFAQSIDSLDGLLQLLKNKAVIPDGNLSDPQRQLWQSGSGEVTVNGDAAEISVTAPRIEAVTVKKAEKKNLGAMTIGSASIPALIAAISQDENALPDSERLLLVIATDAVNSGMKFSSTKRLELEDRGTLPVLYRCGTFSLELESGMQSPALYALRCDGQRMEEIPVTVKNGRLCFTIDTQKLKEPAVFFELLEQ